MDVTELHSVQAARWVWESLWSTRRHAKVNILDIALFDGPGDGVAPGPDGGPTISRWLFTAKDGRIMKKATHNASIGALKQSLLGRVLGGALENGDSGDSRVSSKAAAQKVFATALLSSGESVELDEGAWATWIVGGRGRQGSVSAIVALVPGNSVDQRRGSRHQVTCEFKVKTHGTTVGKGCVGDPCSTPTQGSMTTYVLVSSGLLREEVEKPDEGQEKKHYGGERLVSRVKATNNEVEAKLRRIVQWVQEARGVKVLSMTAMFTVLPSLASGTPGVWLERVLNVRMIPKETGAAVAAPFADTPPVALAQRTIKARGNQEPPIQLDLHHSVESTPAMEGSCQQSEAVLACQQSEYSNILQPTAVEGMSLGAGNTVLASSKHSSSALARTAPPIDVGESAANQSIASILSAATNAVLSVGEQQLPRGEGCDTELSSENGKSISSSTATAASLNRRGRSVVGPDFSHSVARRRCAGDFCSYDGASSGLPARTSRIDGEGGDSGVGTVLNWTDVGMSNKDGGALLDVADKSGAQFSLSHTSVALARAEVQKGDDLYWGEDLRECYEEGGCRVGRLEELTPVQIYKEISVCHRCHDAYQRLDRLRREADRTGRRTVRRTAGLLGNGGILARVGPTVVRDRRTAAAEAGAATLSAEVTAMLKDVDTRTGKLGSEAGIIWRRRLSKSKSICGAEFATEHSQALLTERLARPKPRASDDIYPSDPKRQVKSQGDTPEYTGSRHQRRTGEPPQSLPLLPRRQVWAQGSRQALEPGGPYRDEETSGVELFPPGIPKRSGWTLPETAANTDTAGSMHDDANDRSIPRRCGIERGRTVVNSDGPHGRDSTNVTINAIEAMLEEGGEAYLPECVGDLPEASAVLGTRQTPFRRMGERGTDGNATIAGKHPRRSGRKDKNEPRGAKSRDDKRRVSSSDSQNAGSAPVKGFGQGNEGQTDSVRRLAERPAERFLHPWQRMLEARKREAGRADEVDFTMQKERQRRRDSRREALASGDCRKAGRRVAARRGRQRRRLHRKSGQGDRDGVVVDSGLERTSGTYDGVEVHYGCLDQMRDTLGWARKTFGALMRRLQDKGVALETTAGMSSQNGGSLIRVVNDIQSQLVVFDDTRATFGAEIATSMAAASTTSFQSRCDAACDSFESNFCGLIDELTAVSKNECRGSPSFREESNRATFDKADHSQSGPHAGSTSELPASTAHTKGVSTFGFCPSCSILPVARRCLECEGGGADRDRCSGCFVRDHRDVGRRNHRFLRVSGIGGTGTDSISHEHAPEGDTGTTAEENANGIASRATAINSIPCATRCSRCGDLAAARRCRDCRVDACAACHFLAHRTPSRQAHVTEFVGETAVAVQEALHQQQQLGRRHCGGAQRDEPSTACVRPTSGNGNYGANDGDEIGSKRGGVFGEDVAQSLAQVRSTVDAPVVRPLLSDQQKELVPSCGDSAAADDRAHDIVAEEHSEMKDTGFGGDPVSSNGSKRDSDDSYLMGVRGKEEAQEADESKELEDKEKTGDVSSTDEDTDDEGMMWCPLNIAKVDLHASAAGEGVDEQATPPRTPIQPSESDETEHKPHSQPSYPGAESNADPATTFPNTLGARGAGGG